MAGRRDRGNRLFYAGCGAAHRSHEPAGVNGTMRPS